MLPRLLGFQERPALPNVDRFFGSFDIASKPSMLSLLSFLPVNRSMLTR
jgi:hypothetical protein